MHDVTHYLWRKLTVLLLLIITNIKSRHELKVFIIYTRKHYTVMVISYKRDYNFYLFIYFKRTRQSN